MTRYLLLLASLVLASCGDGGSDDDTCTATTAVEMRNNAFSPSCITVTDGQTVTFTNRDSHGHTVTTDSGQPETFDSGLIAGGATFQHTFNTAGTINMHCDIHPSMKVKAEVE